MQEVKHVSVLSGGFLDELYKQFLADPNSVDPSVRDYFYSLDAKTNSNSTECKGSNKAISDLSEVATRFYRQYGHIYADVNPLVKTNQIADQYGQALEVSLKRNYCSTIGYEIEHIESVAEKDWLYNKIESTNISNLFHEQTREVFLNIILKTKLFEQFLHTKFPGAKRFSIEGGETAILALQETIRLCAVNCIDYASLGMAHRGRLSTLVQVFHKPHAELFAGFMGYAATSEMPSFVGDVKYHLGYKHDVDVDGKVVHLSLAYNPSHLESVNSVVMGDVRAHQDLNCSEKAIPILIHGDASFAGQGCVMESLAMSNIDPYKTGGVLHLIINNQIGFTTDPDKDRSTRYSSDVAKGYDIPVIHVNGSDPEAVVYAVRLAFEYRQQFKKDVVIDLICYRKYGHNEGDEPMFTQPGMYSKIYSKDFKDSVDLYMEKLKQLGSNLDYEKITKDYNSFMNEEFALAKKIHSGEIKHSQHELETTLAKHIAVEKRAYSSYDCNDDIGICELGDSDLATIQSAKTGVEQNKLKDLGLKLLNLPEGFNLNSKIARQFDAKRAMMESGKDIDWGTGEALAFASILSEGINIRFTGEDVERGTFSHRHAILTDQVDGNKYAPLNNIGVDGKIYISNSLLSEFAVLGYEYGYSTANPNMLTIWEAQFGDFANGAQIIIDQYIAAAESKWGTINNLVMLLPHGYEGQGPEHSSARLERFLQLCAQNNMQVCNCTTPASFFNLLRRQVTRDVKKPLVVMTPKSLLRHKLAVSELKDMDLGSEFLPLIPDNSVTNPDRIIFCSGKVYYDLLDKRGDKNIALVRLEQLYPFPVAAVNSIISHNPKSEIVWCQEEPQNMGGYSFVKPIIEKIAKREIRYTGRSRAASPAVGFTNLHLDELNRLLHDALE